MAYAAVISLKQTIHRVLNSSRIFNVSSTQDIMAFSHKEMESLQQVLKRLDDSSNSSSKRLDALDGKIREEVHKLEDVREFHESNQFLISQSESYGDEEKVMKEIRGILVAVKKMKEEYTEELDNPLPDEEEGDNDDDDNAAISSRIGFGGKVVQLTNYFTEIKDYLLRKTIRPEDFGVFSIVGRVGSGRTVVAKTIYDDLYIGKEQSFDCGAWVSIGPEYQLKEILISILAQIHDNGANNDEEILFGWELEDEKDIGEYLYTSLMGRRYIVVLDDVWDTQIWGYLRSSFPEQNNGSLILLTTSLKEVFAGSFCIYEITVYDDNIIWDFLLGTMFIYDEESCPLELKEAGKKIVENCQGLSISFAKVMLYLSKGEKTLECWNVVAADKTNPIYMVADRISEMSKINQLYNSTQDKFERLVIEKATTLLNGIPRTIKDLKNEMFPERLFPKMGILSLCGMAGIGKTTLAKQIFEDPSILCRFDHSVWVTLGPKYHSEEILLDIQAQIYPGIDKMYLKGDVKLAKDLCAHLSNKRCLIVFDDVWNKEPLHYLEKLFLDINGEALVTTRVSKVATFGYDDMFSKISLLSEEDSWCLFREKVFGEDQSCPPELDKAGRKIAKNCEGLPLMIVKVADILHKAEKKLDFWNEVAEKENPIFKKVYNEISKVLLLSYNNLPQHLKTYFLYMGVFRQDYEIPRVKLAKLWFAEGFLEQNMSLIVEDPFGGWLLELDDRNVVVVPKESSNFKIKTCCLHSVFWHLSNNLAVKNKFFHVFNSSTDNLIEGIKSQRRLCIHNNTLLGINNVFNSIVPNSTARSLLCTGPYHKYSVPIFFGLRLLRVFDALTIRFYEFPVEVLKLSYLKYLAITCDGMLPSSISKLWNLQFLIVCKHLSIISPRAQLSLPMEIWDMKNLKHLQFMGSNLPNPYCGVDLFPNLLTLLNVNAHNFTKGILKRIYNLKKLGIQIELELDDDGKPFRCLNRICRLRRLESLKCVVLNPELRSKVVAPPAPLSMFPSSLTKLHLSGLGYPWEYKSIIGSLPKLEVLKLTSYAFQGPMWDAHNNHFNELKFLLIEDSDLVCWKARKTGFTTLLHLSIKYCFKLEEFPYFPFLNMIEAVDCNPSVVNWTEQIKEKHLR